MNPHEDATHYYKRFVGNLNDTLYRNLLEIARQEKLLSVFREENDIGKICKVVYVHGPRIRTIVIV